MIKRASIWASVSAALIVSGCVTPDVPSAVTPDRYVAVSDVVTHIKCELASAAKTSKREIQSIDGKLVFSAAGTNSSDSSLALAIPVTPVNLGPSAKYHAEVDNTRKVTFSFSMADLNDPKKFDIDCNSLPKIRIVDLNGNVLATTDQPVTGIISDIDALFAGVRSGTPRWGLTEVDYDSALEFKEQKSAGAEIDVAVVKATPLTATLSSDLVQSLTMTVKYTDNIYYNAPAPAGLDAVLKSAQPYQPEKTNAAAPHHE